MIGSNIRRVLKENLKTQKFLSAHLGITLPALGNKLMGNRRFSIDEIILIKEVLNVSYDELLNQED